MSTPNCVATRVALVGVLACLAGCATLASAPPLQFADRTYIAPHTSTDTSISYEAYVAPSIFVYDNEPRNFIALTENGGPTSVRGFRMFATPVFVIRQLNDSSSAVRTPSFNPRVSGEFYRIAPLKRTMTAGLTSFSFARVDAFRITIAHHSDGQAGCFLDGQSPTKAGSFEADDCSTPPDTGVLRTNRANGDFSTTYLSFLWHETLTRYEGGSPLTASFGVGYDWELPKSSGVPGALPDIERQLYGAWRKHVQADVMYADEFFCPRITWACHFTGRTRVTAMYEWAPTDLGPLASRLATPIPHFRSYFDFSHTFDALHNAGILVRRVDGQDYYNIGFVHRRQATLIGIVLDLGGYDFRTP